MTKRITIVVGGSLLSVFAVLGFGVGTAMADDADTNMPIPSWPGSAQSDQGQYDDALDQALEACQGSIPLPPGLRATASCAHSRGGD